MACSRRWHRFIAIHFSLIGVSIFLQCHRIYKQLFIIDFHLLEIEAQPPFTVHTFTTQMDGPRITTAHQIQSHLFLEI